MTGTCRGGPPYRVAARNPGSAPAGVWTCSPVPSSLCTRSAQGKVRES